MEIIVSDKTQLEEIINRAVMKVTRLFLNLTPMIIIIV